MNNSTLEKFKKVTSVTVVFALVFSFASPAFAAPDTTPPPIPSITSPANNSVLKTSALDKVDWTDETDPSSPVTYIYSVSFSSAINIDGSFVSPLYTSGALSASEIPTAGTSEGVYYVSVKAVDSAGNSSSWTTPIKITVDNTAPIVSEVTAVPTPSTDTTPSYTFTTNEAGAITYGGSCASGTTAAVVGSNTITFNALGDGTYSNCTITITDVATNASTPFSVNTFVVDTTGPSVPTNTLPHNSTISTDGWDFTWDASTDSTLPITYEYQASQNSAVDGFGVLTTGVWNSGTLTTNMIHSAGAPDGVWYWQVRAKDGVGNYSAWSPLSNMTKDTTPPVITLNGGTVSLTVGGAAYSEPGATAIDAIDGNRTANIVIDASAINQLVPGAYTVTYNVSDTQGNAATTVNRIVTVSDVTGPVINGGVALSNIVVEQVGNADAVVTYTNPTAIDDVDSPISVLCGPASGSLFSYGVTAVLCSAQDTVPNVSNASFNVTIQDTVLPTASAVSLTSDNTVSTLATVGDTITLTFTTSEAVSTPTVSIAGNAASVSNTGNDYTATYTLVGGETQGSAAISIDFTDIVGNDGTRVTATTDTTDVVIDTVGPVISSLNSSITFPPGANISWTTNEAATTFVEYGPTDSYGSSTTLDPTLITSHTANISGLSQVFTYHFRVVSTDEAGNTTTASDDVFTTSGATGGSVPSDAGVGSPAPTNNPSPTPTPTPTPAPSPSPSPAPTPTPTPETPAPVPTPETTPTPETPTPTPTPTPENSPADTPVDNSELIPTSFPNGATGGNNNTGGGTGTTGGAGTGGTGGTPAPFNPADATLDQGGGEPAEEPAVEESFNPADATLDQGGGEPAEESSYTLLWILLGLLALLNTWWFFVAKNKPTIPRN